MRKFSQSKWWLFVILMMVATACGGKPSNVMRVLAGSELKDIEPFVGEIERETGIKLEFEYIGTLDGTQKLLDGNKDYDLAWFSHGKYLELLQSGRGIIATQEKMMYSPVVLGVKQSRAEAFGWLNNNNVTWQDIEIKSNSGELRFAMTNPASSNSGFTALMGVAAAFAKATHSLTTDDINVPALQQFFKGQKLTAGSSGWLADSYVQSQNDLDGIINYESVLLQLNESGNLREKLVLIYPKEGIITADYPLMLLNSAKRAEYDKLITYMHSEKFQQKMMQQTLRRPILPSIQLDSRIPNPLLVELPFPNKVDVINALLNSYLDKQRIPAHAYFVLDVSGSMEGAGLDNLKLAIKNLTGEDQTLSGQFSRFREREKITLVTFNEAVVNVSDFEVSTTNDETTMREIRNYVDDLRADGGTAIYSALQYSYELALQQKQTEPDRYYSIVLMSDGENTDGIDYNSFENTYQAESEKLRNIRTFTVLFGKADKNSMEKIATLTGGRMFDGTKDSLAEIFKQIRGYQ